MTGIFKGLSPFANETDKEIQIEAYAIDNLIEMNRLGFDVLFEMRIDVNPFDTTRYAIWVNLLFISFALKLFVMEDFKRLKEHLFYQQHLKKLHWMLS